MKITTYKQARFYLERFINQTIFKVKLISLPDPLLRMRILLSMLDNPQNKFKSVLVGGTAGKGSTAYLISHILTTSGYKTGFTISPHLQKLTERLQINGKQIPDGLFVEMVDTLQPIVKKMEKMETGAPSYFELLVALAFVYFAKEKVDIAVVEVGLGGEFDATNTLWPLIAIITNVSLDHTAILGKTVIKIAKAKAGIIKKRKEHMAYGIWQNKKSLVVTGVRQPSVVKIVEQRAESAGSQLYRLGKDFSFKIKKEDTSGTVFDFSSSTLLRHPEFSSGSPKNSEKILKQVQNDVSKIQNEASQTIYNDLVLSLKGRHQVENASLAIETILQLKQFGFLISESGIRNALSTAFFPGRFEVITYNLQPTTYNLVLDGAHNPAKMRSFIGSLKKLYPKQKKVFLIAFKYDKNIQGMLKEIVKVADVIVATQFTTTTDMQKNAGMDIKEIKDQRSKIKDQKRIPFYFEKDVRKALEKACEMAGNDSLVVVTGSLFLVGEVREILQKSN